MSRRRPVCGINAARYEGDWGARGVGRTPLSANHKSLSVQGLVVLISPEGVISSISRTLSAARP